MILDVRPTARLRGDRALSLTGSLAPVVDVLADGDVDLSRVRVVCDWVQYRHNFRDVVDARPILPPARRHPRNGAGPADGAAGRQEGDLVELAVDLRRCGDDSVAATTREALAGLSRPDTGCGRLFLEDWTRGTESAVWSFNALYWRFLDVWEQATGRRYEQALPGGHSDATNLVAVRELIGQLFSVWDALAARNALPEELYVVELGVGNGGQAKAWLDEFRALDAAHGRGYYRRLQYLMCDYSDHVLALARETVKDHLRQVSSFSLDATRPSTALKFLRYKVFLVYVSNVYDNLPTEEIAQLGGHTFRTEVRAYLPGADATRLAAGLGVSPADLAEPVRKLLGLGPALLAEAMPARFADADAAAAFWRDVWQALRVAERYVPLAGLDPYEIAPGVSGEMLRPMLENEGDVRLHVSNGAVASFTDILPLLHPYGRLHCHDLFVTDVHQYRTGFRGPGKYDGSVVNWVNGPLLRRLGARRGFDVTFAPFAHREETNIVTMTAQARD